MRRTFFIIICIVTAVFAKAQNDYTKNIEAAKNGDPKAQHIIGCCYDEGEGVEKDESQAVYWWRKAAEQGNVFSQHNLGGHYKLGIGIEQDYRQALYWFRKAADQGSSISQYELGELYENGFGVDKDMSKAFFWYKKAAEQGDAEAQFKTGYLYEIGEGTTEDKSKAMEWYRKAAAKGNLDSQYNIGCLYYNGEGVKKDYLKAMEWYRKAASQGDTESQIALAEMYRNGVGIKQDKNKALEWYKKAAEQGDANAEAYLGANYYEKQDYAKAYQWYEKSAEHGNPSGAILIGYMYEKGEGVNKDYKKAIEWFNNAVELGDYTGFWCIGNLYYLGNGVTKSYAKAAEWYYKGAIKGEPVCQYDLGELYYEGWGVEKDYKEAIKWMSKAAAQDHYGAQHKLEEWKAELPYDYFASSETFTPPIDQTQKTDLPQQAGQSTKTQQITNTKEITFVSDVDDDMPLCRTTNRDIFAIIIGNEEYKNVVKVPYAKKDAKIFSEYVEKTLGVPYEQIKHIENATYNDLRIATNWIIQAMKVCRGKGKAIIYYAGHGIPNETDFSSYILPVDGIGNDSGSAFSLTDLYEKLGEVEAQSITVFLDACFSGSKREEGMLTSARGVAIKARQSAPRGNMIVFSAAQGDETAYPYKDMQHGLFTYFLLKKLKETKGEVTLGELSDYLTDEVGRQSFVKNNKMQTPTVSVASSLKDCWRQLKLK